MKKTIITISFCFLGMLTFHNDIQAKTNIIMLFGSDGYPPFYLKGATSGMFIEFLDEFEKEYPQFNVLKKSVPRKRIDFLMENGEADAVSLNNTMFLPKENVGIFEFSIPIFETGDHVFMYKGNEFNFNKPEDLFGKRIAIILGNGYGEYDKFIISKNIKCQAVANWIQMPRLLMINRVDGFFGNRHATPYNLKINEFDISNYVQSRKALYEFTLHTQVHKKHGLFIKSYNEFIQESKNNELINDIVAKWLNEQ